MKNSENRSYWPVEESGSFAAAVYDLAIRMREKCPLKFVEDHMSAMLTQPHVVLHGRKLYLFSMEGNWCANVRG